jgi:hypothetical protein
MEKQKKIQSPTPLSVVKYVGHSSNDNINSCDVLIRQGSYLSRGRVSNFWYWQRILEDGSLNGIESGYGNFVQSDKFYQIEVTVKQITE